MLHPLLERQLRKLGLAAGALPADAAAWQGFLKRIDITYQQADQDRYLLERSLLISSTEMREALEQARAMNQALINSQAALEALQQEARRAREAAESANHAKSEFLANISHEIRTPMTAILGFVDVLAEQSTALPPEWADSLDTIRRNGEYLLAILNDVLDLSRIEAGRIQIERVCCSPKSVVDDVRSLMLPRARAKTLDFETRWDGEMPAAICTDPTRLRQILINLVTNAIKFTEAGRVELVVRSRHRQSRPVLEFDVIDTGIGMTPEQITKLFKPFVQADASMTRRFGGTGLGLAITARLAELLGGEVRVVRTAPGVGAWFRVQIAAEPALPQGAVVPAPIRAGAGACTKPSTGNRVSARVLLVEDGPDNQRLIAHVLRKAGADVTIAVNGQLGADAALKAVAAGQPFDVILMDMQMPVLDGYSATALLRQKGYRRPIVALTAHAMSHDRERCLAAGCDEFVPKPIDRALLLEIVRRYADSSRAREHAQPGAPTLP